MRVAVTGASGFIGRHVVRALRDRDATVIAISRHPDPVQDTSIEPLALDLAASGDNTFERIGSPDVLLHLAWGGLPNYRSSHHVEEELPRHQRFLDACIESGLARLVVLGSCLEYGVQSGELDEATPLRPSTAYGEAKCLLHEHLQARRMRYSLGLGWLRLFYLYGPGQAATSLYSQLRAAVDSGASGFDMSAGDQIRDFLAIETAAAKIAALTLHHADAGTVNVCSGRPATVIDTVRNWLNEWNAEITLNRGVYQYPDYEAFEFWGSVRRLNTLVGAT